MRKVAYKGFPENLHLAFRDASWARFLSEHGIAWDVDAPTYPRAGEIPGMSRGDFRTVDLFLAVRPSQGLPWSSKLATKLYNCWHAGVPAILGEELAFRELRRSDLDYFEISSQEAARAVVLKLHREPMLYRKMIENGWQRARDFTMGAVLERWRLLLFETIPADTRSRRGGYRRLMALRLVRLLSWSPDVRDLLRIHSRGNLDYPPASGHGDPGLRSVQFRDEIC